MGLRCARLWILYVACAVVSVQGCSGSSSVGDAVVKASPDCPLPTPAVTLGCATLVPVVQSPGSVLDDLEISHSGCEVQVADTFGSSVRRFALADGKEILPPLAEEITLPWSLVQSPDGERLYVAEIQAGRIYQITAPGSKKLVWDGFTLPMDLGFDASDNLYVCETDGTPARFGNGWITRVSRDGSRERIVEQTPGVCDLTLDGAGGLYYVGADDEHLYFRRSDGVTEVVAGGLTGPTDILYDASRKGVWVSYGADVAFVDPVGKTVQTVTCTDTLVSAEDMALDREGNLYMDDAGAGTVYRLDFGGSAGG